MTNLIKERFKSSFIPLIPPGIILLAYDSNKKYTDKIKNFISLIFEGIFDDIQQEKCPESTSLILIWQ